MRFVIFGAGAIGGATGARLAQSGFDVALIARGPHYRAIRERGLTFEEPGGSSVLEIPAFDDPAGIDWTPDHVVLLTAKSQDTGGALQALRGAAAPSTPVVCLQNGIENERLALRLFANVYGAVVMVPAAHMEAGIVQAYGTELTGVIDVGRYPHGVDELCHGVAAALEASRFSSKARSDVMRFKHAKLILNLTNAVDAICEPGPASDELAAAAREEGRAALRAAGLEFVAEEVDDVRGRWQRIGVREIAGRRRAGSSTWQSIARGTGAVETDYLNGEVVLLGRLHGSPTPINEALCELAARHARERRPPATVPAEEVLALARRREAAA